MELLTLLVSSLIGVNSRWPENFNLDQTYGLDRFEICLTVNNVMKNNRIIKTEEVLEMI